jgi:hypothetical protein
MGLIKIFREAKKGASPLFLPKIIKYIVK